MRQQYPSEKRQAKTPKTLNQTPWVWRLRGCYACFDISGVKRGGVYAACQKTNKELNQNQHEKSKSHFSLRKQHADDAEPDRVTLFFASAIFTHRRKNVRYI